MASYIVKSLDTLTICYFDTFAIFHQCHNIREALYVMIRGQLLPSWMLPGCALVSHATRSAPNSAAQKSWR